MSFDPISYLLGTKAAGGGGVTVEALSVTANGTYTAASGKAYSPVTVAVPKGPAVTAQVTIAGGNAYSMSITLPRAMSNFFVTVEADAATQAAIYGESSSYYYVVSAIFQFPVGTLTDGSTSVSKDGLIRYRPSTHAFIRYFLNAVSLSGNTLTLETDVTTSFIGGGTYIVKVWEVDVS